MKESEKKKRKIKHKKGKVEEIRKERVKEKRTRERESEGEHFKRKRNITEFIARNHEIEATKLKKINDNTKTLDNCYKIGHIKVRSVLQWELCKLNLYKHLIHISSWQAKCYAN